MSLLDLDNEEIYLQARRSAGTLYNNCSEKIRVSVGDEKNRPTSSITLRSQDTKFYLYVHSDKDDFIACAIAFEAQGKYCNPQTNKCTDWKELKPWFSYRSDNIGIARIDFANSSSGIYIGKFRPLNSNASWSNEVVVKVDNENPPADIGLSSSVPVVGQSLPRSQVQEQSLINNIDLSKYFMFNPGNTWIYQSKNYISGVTYPGVIGTTRLQIEADRLMCGLTIRPLRFTKDNPTAYWNPTIPNTNFNAGGTLDLRWMVVSPNSLNQKGFDKYFWAFRDKRYPRISTYPLRDIDTASYGPGYIYGNMTARVPGYNLGPKYIRYSSYLDFAEGDSLNVPDRQNDEYNCEPIGEKDKARAFPSSWKIRIEKDVKIHINNLHFKYFGPALRIDYFEGGTPLEQNIDGFLRESWFFIENVGLAKIQVKHFNNYGAINLYSQGSEQFAPNCIDDVDCWSDYMLYPNIEITLDKYFVNNERGLKLNAEIRKMNASEFGKRAVLKKGDTYEVQLYTNKKEKDQYIGYVEIRMTNSSGDIIKQGKWQWIDDKNFANESYQFISNLPIGQYQIQWRVWIPNEQFIKEELVTNTYEDEVSWSDPVTLVIESE